MNSGKTLEDLLAGARLTPRPYTNDDIAAAEDRLLAKLADRMLHGALSFDDLTRPVRGHVAARTRPAGPTPRGCGRGPDTDLRLLCRLVISQPDALHAMSTFVAGRILEPDGALVLACVLHLAGREDSARFWWQYAAGAGDVSASYCLFLHHTAHGEVVEANWWHDRPRPRTRPVAGPRRSLHHDPGLEHPAGRRRPQQARPGDRRRPRLRTRRGPMG
jgi:hypothetical protein